MNYFIFKLIKLQQQTLKLNNNKTPLKPYKQNTYRYLTRQKINLQVKIHQENLQATKLTKPF